MMKLYDNKFFLAMAQKEQLMGPEMNFFQI